MSLLVSTFCLRKIPYLMLRTFCLLALVTAPLTAGDGVSAVLHKEGQADWVGAFLLDGPREAARPLVTLPRGETVRIHPERAQDGYMPAERLDRNGKVAQSGWVHRKFLNFTEPAPVPVPSPAAGPRVKLEAALASPATPPVAAPRPQPTTKPEDRMGQALQALETRLKALEQQTDGLLKRIQSLEKNGTADPGVDFLQRLQKLEMDVRARDSSALPTVPFPDAQRHEDAASEPDPPPSRIPGMSWIMRGW
ncbi:MAG: hypothetical protein HY814_01460 [Candidatus Riflebacteria bacterium]|nr:hypothetical protein [Candidatus Riflebacteria bacterium]